MTRRAFILSVLFLVVCLAPGVFAQSSGPAPADQISGIWTDGNGRGLDLKFDGQHTLTGSLNPETPNPVPFKEGTFDSKTGVFKLSAERTVNGATQKIVIDGKLADGKLTGTYDSNGQKGTFAFSRKKA